MNQIAVQNDGFLSKMSDLRKYHFLRGKFVLYRFSMSMTNESELKLKGQAFCHRCLLRQSVTFANVLLLLGTPAFVSAQPGSLERGKPVDGMQISIDSVSNIRGTKFPKNVFYYYYTSNITLSVTIKNVGAHPIYFVCPEEPQIKRAMLLDQQGQTPCAYDELSQVADPPLCDVKDIIPLAPSQVRHVTFYVDALRKIPVQGRYVAVAVLRAYPEDDLTQEASAYLKRKKLHLWRGPVVKSAAYNIELN